MRTPIILPRFHFLAICCVPVALSVAPAAHAVSSAELYTTAAYQYGRFEARVQFAGGSGVVSSFFLWKDGSEVSGVFWNELDFEKLEADCHLETNALYGDPEASHNQVYDSDEDLCGEFHTYTYEWTPDYIAWFVDGVEIRRETGDVATAYRDNTSSGMQLRFNVWPGDASFGGVFDPAILPVHQYVNWVQFYSYVDGAFQLDWREDFDANTLPSGWATANWSSPKNLSNHTPANVTFIDGYAVLSLTADDATGPAGAMPMDTTDDDIPGAGGTAGSPNDDGTAGMGGTTGSVAGSGGAAGSPDDDGAGGMSGTTGSVAGSGGAANSPNDDGTAGENGANPIPQPSGTGEQPTPAEGAGGQPNLGGTAGPSAPSGPTNPTPSGVATAAPTTAPSESAGPIADSDADGSTGCSCRMPGAPANRWGWAALASGLVVSRLRRRLQIAQSKRLHRTSPPNEE